MVAVMNTPEDDANAQAALDAMIAAGIPVKGFEFKHNGYYFHFTRKPTESEIKAAEVIAWENINHCEPRANLGQ